MTISFSGIGSGNDWNGLIDQLVAIERQPATKLTTDKTNASKQLSVVGDLLTKLGSLSSRASAMSTSNGLYAVTATSSDANQVKVTSTGGGAAGKFALRVQVLARGESRQSQEFESSSPGVTGSLTIAVGAGDPISVSYTATDSLADIAARIGKIVPGVTATALSDGSKTRIMLSSQATGATAGALTITESGDGLGLAPPESITAGARDARISINGVTATAASNHLVGVVPGVALDLVAVTADGVPDVNVSLARDAGSLKQRLKDLVSATNDVEKVLQGQLSYSGAKKGSDTLFGDLATQQLQRRLGAALGSVYDTTSSLRDLGITQGSDGTLAIDESKLDALLAADPGKVERLLTGPDGLAKALGAIADEHTSATGPYVTRQSSLRDRMKRDDDAIVKINDRADDAQVRLRRQFAALDKAMTAYNSQMTYLSSLKTG